VVTRCAPKITMAHVRLRVRFVSFPLPQAVGSENASRHCNAVVNHDDDCLNGEKCRHSGQDDPDPSEAVSEDGANHRMESDGNDTIPRPPLRFPLGPFASTPATTPGRLSCLWIRF
jgi:hypothetical protein